MAKQRLVFEMAKDLSVNNGMNVITDGESVDIVLRSLGDVSQIAI